jgi:nitrate reductase gamma subunit
VNPLLWLGEWGFHLTFLLALVRHLRYFLNPVPAWVWSLQTTGMIAGYILPISLLYILIIRLLTTREKYSSRQNILLLGLVLAISSIGVLMHIAYKPDLVDVKLFVFGIMTFAPRPVPESGLFLLHFSLFLAVILLLPSHIFTAPFVMYEARKRDESLHRVMHDRENNSKPRATSSLTV